MSLGCDLREGKLVFKKNADFFGAISASLFSGAHSTTYKYCFLKCILDNIYELDDDYALSFDVIGETFASTYWNLVAVHHIPQMPKFDDGKKSTVERIIESIINEKPYLDEVRFENVNDLDKLMIATKIIKDFSTYVIGAFYGDTSGLLYGFSKKQRKIWLNENSFRFLSNNKVLLEQVNYYQWFKMCDSILHKTGRTIENLPKVLEDITLREDLYPYKKELISKGEDVGCFYCGSKLNKGMHLDHVVPWSFLKRDDLWNFVFSCSKCNISKNNRLPQNEYIDKLIERNDKLGIAHPDIKYIVSVAKANGVKSDWKPRKHE